MPVVTTYTTNAVTSTTNYTYHLEADGLELSRPRPHAEYTSDLDWRQKAAYWSWTLHNRFCGTRLHWLWPCTLADFVVDHVDH